MLYIIHFILFITSSHTALALTGSKAATNPTWNAVVYIQTQARQESPAICNATLISPTLLVTAAHCLIDAIFLKSSELFIQVGEYSYRQTESGPPQRIGYKPHLQITIQGHFFINSNLKHRLLRHGFKTQVGPHEDLAVIELPERPIDTPMPSLIPTPPRLVSNTQLERLRRSWVNFTPNVVSINFLETLSHLDTRQMITLNKVTAKQGYIESLSQSRVSPGDSGAPVFVFIDNQWHLAAVTKGRASNLFGNWDVFTTLEREKLCLLLKETRAIEFTRAHCL